MFDEIVEARILSTEGETYSASRTVALFADNDLRHPFILRICFVDLVTIDEHDDVSVLLNRTAFANIRHHRAPVGALLDLTVELREGDHRDVEFFGQRLEATGDFRQFLRAVFLGGETTHQL